jgi:NAD dependent epimerase/dehydratase family enzyme
VTNREFTRTLGHVLHRPTILPAPAFALRLAIGEFAEILLASQRVIPRVALDAGYSFKYPQLEAALHASVK